jgi:hypothetical protein
VTRPHGNLTALLHGVQESLEAGGRGRRTSGGRRSKEKKRLSSTDGRVRRGLGRDRQYNIQVTQDWLDAVEDACERFDLTKNEFGHRAGLAYIAALKAGTADD